VAAAACIVYLGLAFPVAAANQVAPRSVSAINSTLTSAQLWPNTETPSRKTKHSATACRILRRSTIRRIDLCGDDGLRKNQTAPQVLIADLSALGPRSGAMTAAPVLPVHGFYCLHKHIRERAPPILKNQI
jgi:hypothetical protein